MLRKQFLVNFGLSLCLGLLNDGLDSEAFVRVLLAEIELEVRHLGLRTLLLPLVQDVLFFGAMSAAAARSRLHEVVLHGA